jgi:dihydrofolate reductase
MGHVIVIEFTTLDGVVSDPDGSAGTPTGGWAFRFGPEAVAGDKFRLGPVLDSGILLLGRTTWELFARLWPHRQDPFASRMNAMPKLVAASPGTDLGAWNPSTLVGGDLVGAVRAHREQRDVVVTGSLSVVRQLQEQSLVDEYRLLTFPTVLGTGEPLFPRGGRPIDLLCSSAEQSGAAVLTRWSTAR